MPIQTKKWLDHVLKVKESLPENTDFDYIIKVAINKWGIKLSNKKKNKKKNKNKKSRKKRKIKRKITRKNKK